MSIYSFLTHLLFSFSLVIVSAIITRWLASRKVIIDTPNARSSHAEPTPRGGGVAIVATFLLGIIAIYLLGDSTLLSTYYYWVFLFSSMLIAGISLYDDISGRSFQVKLLTQLFAAILVVVSGIYINQVTLPFLGAVQLGVAGFILTVFWIVGLTNAYNFMDGIDGLAASTAIIVGLFFCYITFNQGSLFIYITCYAVVAGAVGFLFYNFPPAKIFMGDVGSAFLGFTFAVMAIIAARYDHSQTSILVVPLLLFHFIYDTIFTMGRRILAGENPAQAHCSHLYQLFVRMGASHLKVTLIYALLAICQGLAAVWIVIVSGGDGGVYAFIFFPFLALYIPISLWIVEKARKQGLIQ